MSYQVLARKWRPRDFGALVGQDHVVRALRHALESGRLHHAYLLTGTRGVGKTTLARILAKCLNCETGITATPCGRCSACQEIDGGRYVDLLEVDAATNTRVDEMRQLLDTAQYAPTRGRFKVYVIDEVHMLSNSAFNAMLKTLEEPPEHLKFILATTDPQKIPVTVLSRCLQFNLKQMPVASIAAHLEGLLRAEKIAFEGEALQLIGRAASGSMRDALSLLDQAIAHGGGQVSAESVRAMLGAVDESYLFRILEAVASSDGPRLLAVVDEMQARSLSFDTALQDLARVLLQIGISQVAPGALESDVAYHGELQALAQQMDAELVQLCYEIALQGREDLPLAPDEHAGFVMTALRMLAFRPDRPAPGAPAGWPEAAATPISQPPRATQGFDGDWPSLARQLSVTGAARELARHAALARHDDATFELVVPGAKAHLADRGYVDKLRVALEQQLGRHVNLKVTAGATNGSTVAAQETKQREARQSAADQAVQDDRFVRDLVDIFDAKVVGAKARTTDGGD
ncbi:MAG TPA: DNA polymerase III subunit gamma/tau [Burkholderiales bacterium]|nr:DNA polymerase III subunit gamma/tau [Burkholderiales bacterium]